jgi:hypothetical protein
MWADIRSPPTLENNAVFIGFPMIKRIIATLMIFSFMVLALLACGIVIPVEPKTPYALPTYSPSPLFSDNQATEYTDAQATLSSGEGEMTELSRQADVVSQNMALAEATQEFLARQTQIGWDATAIVQGQDATAAAQNQGATATGQSQDATTVAQNQGATATAQSQAATATAQSQGATAAVQIQDATATDFAYIRNVTQTAQGLVMLDIQATQAALSNATLAAYSLTATPWSAIQADIVQTRNESNRQAWWKEFVATPLKAILFTLLVLLLIVGSVLVYLRLMPVLELRLRTIWRENSNPLLLVRRKIVDSKPPQSRFARWMMRQPDLSLVPSYGTPQVEIIDPFDPPIALWIEETEQKLRTDGRIQL